MDPKRPRNSTRPKPAARRSSQKPKAARQRARAGDPDLQSILHTFTDALSLVQAAHMAMRYADNWGPEEYTLRKGIEALRAVREDVERADRQLPRLRRMKGAAGH